jgi:P4 family phage/plasmid primase-like protien
MKFLKEVSNGDIELVVNIMEGFAYCLVPDYPIQKAFMLVGSGSNGKSTFLRVLMEFLGGKKNVSNVTLQSISNNRFSVANLQFKLANISYDLPDKAIYDSGMFKSLTGGDTISAEHKGVQRVQQFSNSAKMWFSTNKIPDVNDDSSAYYRRWNVCEFKVKFGEGNDIFSELVTDEELSGIFNLIMKFFYPVIIKNKKFTCSKDAETTRTMYLRMGNTVKAFADECMSFDPNGEIAKSDVYNLYVKFCNRHRMMFITEAGFWRALKSLVNYTERQKERGGNRWIFGQRVNISDGSASDASTASTSTTISLYYNIFIELYEYRVKGIEADARDAVDVNTKNMENTENMEISLEGDINDLPTE